ncbi:MAG TPA: response regulator [Chloroflexota bacterium]|nr:response regulator [Chloroflexota bacterium]
MSSVLVVDDEPGIVQFMSAALEDEGFSVTTASDGRRATELAAQRRPDLVVLDWMLPRLDGDGVAEEIRRMYGDDVPILLVTADGRAQMKAERVGAFAYLSKPFDLDRFLNLIRSKLES